MTEDLQFEEFRTKMKGAKVPEIFIENFRNYYRQLRQGGTGLIAEDEILPVETLADAEDIPKHILRIGEENLPRTIFLKLNGGLGTSMGLEKAKSLLVVKNGHTFLDIIARQAVQGEYKLLLMNSFSTHQDSIDFLENYPKLHQEKPLDFIQNKEPKVDKKSLRPVSWPDDPQLEWCPPGHGDLYISIAASGVLDLLLEQGYRYAFISNADNLGAVLDPGILGHFVDQQIPFMMEVANRTEADKKGGHLARWKNGQLLLREIAQCPLEHHSSFRNIRRHRFFNTNNLWLDLGALKDLLETRRFILNLPLIRNQKTVDPRDPSSPAVYQIETAVGSAISVFKNSGAIRVPRRRFAPVKNTEDLLSVRSDLYQLTADYRVIPLPEREKDLPDISLDDRFYKVIDDFEARFPEGAPSLRQCQQLTIEGDIRFEKNVVIQGRVRLVNPERGQRVIRESTTIVGTSIEEGV